MRHSVNRFAALFCLTAGLGACAAPGGCDPRQADLFSGIGCQVGGGYATRQTALEQQRDDADQRRLHEFAMSAQADNDRAEAERELHERQERLAVLRRQTDAMQAQLAAARLRQGADTVALTRAQADLEALKRQQNATPAGPSEADLQEMENRRQQILRTINDL